MFLHNIRRFKDSIISRKAKQLSVKNFGENPQQGQKKRPPRGAALPRGKVMLPCTTSRLDCFASLAMTDTVVDAVIASEKRAKLYYCCIISVLVPETEW